MALVGKGSRRIVVDGTVYRWRLRDRPTWASKLMMPTSKRGSTP